MNVLNYVDEVVVIADCEKVHTKNVNLFSRKRDKAGEKNVLDLIEGLKEIFVNPTLYKSPKEFIRQIHKHKRPLVFPYWHGENSRNRFALISSICESYGIPYVGGDTYSNIVCGDKILSKDICRQSGLDFPKYEIIRNPKKLNIQKSLNYPIIIKPIFEGSSIGITQENIIQEEKDIRPLANILYKNLNQPMVIEEFIPGDEVCIAIIGQGENIKHWGAIKRIHQTDKSFFEKKVYGFYEKLDEKFSDIDASNLISKDTLKKLFDTFKSLDKIEYLRIDGKLFNNTFYCIELSHDMSLNKNGAFFNALKYKGLNHKDVIKELIINCLERHSSQYSSLP